MVSANLLTLSRLQNTISAKRQHKKDKSRGRPPASALPPFQSCEAITKSKATLPFLPKLQMFINLIA